MYYPLALHLQPCFSHLGYKRGSLPATEAAMDAVISLPIYPELSDAQQDTVIAAVKGLLRVSRIKIGVVARGAWGKNHVRTIAGLAEAELAAVCDMNPVVRESWPTVSGHPGHRFGG